VVLKPVEKLTLALVKQLAASCNTPAAGDYVGNPTLDVNRLAYPLVHWPSPAQRAAGQAWVRCDLGVQARTVCCPPLAPQAASLRGVVGEDPARFHGCLGEIPDPARSQLLTSCKKPHRAETLPDQVQLETTQYPSAAVLAKKGRVECAQQLAHRSDANHLVITTSWQSRTDWSSGTLYGFCWIHLKSGLLPPIE
jgi:hypothetical protein